MASATGQPASLLIDDLLSRSHEFSFIQVMRCARAFLEKGSGNDLPEVSWSDRIKIKPLLSFAFPPADVSSVNRNENGFEVVTNFLGLYGSSSPLPTFYTEDLLDEASRDSSVSREFLDIIHQRLYRLYFDCWSKYRLFIRVAEEKNPLDRERLFCLIGLREKELRDNVPDPRSLLRYAGLLTQYPRSASGLLALLRDALGIAKITIEQCVLRKVAIPGDQRMRLGMTSMSLGMNTVLGSHINDRMGKFRIIVGPLKKKEFDAFLPGGPLHAKLTSLARIYITDPLDYDLKLILAAGEAQPIRLGDPNGARLGLSSWCFGGDTLGEVSAVFPVTHNPSMPAPSRDATPKSGVSTLTDRYREELAQLRKLAAQYAEKHPDMASLVCGRTPDAGIERLFEGVAFLNAHLRMKLDDDFPEVIHELMEVLDPASLRPVPASTIVAFDPKPNLTESRIIPAGTELKSIPVEGVECLFVTCWPVEVHPLSLTYASFAQQPGKSAAITLSLELKDITLSNWKVNKLRLFLAGEHHNAANLYLALMHHVKRIVLTPLQDDGQPCVLAATLLKPVGFEDAELLFPTTSNAASHQSLREYFIQPDKFLFLDLMGFDTWRDRGEGTGFEIRFELDKLSFGLHKVSDADFVLFAAPAVNLFNHQARPITITNRFAGYPLSPEGGNAEHYHIYAVDKVCGLLRGHADSRVYSPEEQHTGGTGDAPLYKLTRRKSPLHSGIDFTIAIIDTAKAPSAGAEILDVALSCTNGFLPNRLAIGEICIPTSNSPAYATFSNVKTIISSANPALGDNQLWKRFSFLELNLHLLTLNSLRSLLETCLLSHNPDYQDARKLKNRVYGIAGLDIRSIDRLLGRTIQRGWEIRIKLQKKCFASDGDLYLFGAILDRFMALFVTQVVFTQTVIEDVQGQREYKWPERMGKRPLV